MNLRFTHSFQSNSVNFLDVTLTGNNNMVFISPYRKSTATNSTLMSTSCHPNHVVKNLAVGELIRMKRNSTLPEVYDQVKLDTCTRLRNRKYPAWVLNRASHIVDKISCLDLLKQNVLMVETITILGIQ